MNCPEQRGLSSVNHGKGRWRERAIKRNWSTDLMIIIIFHGDISSTVISQDKQKNVRNILDRRRRETGLFTGILNLKTVKADSHIACRAHAVPMPFPCHPVPLIYTCPAAPLPCSDSAVSFVKVRVVAGNIRTASPAD
jgi:hypothetical protein